jgi:hypothetical protein
MRFCSESLKDLTQETQSGQTGEGVLARARFPSIPVFNPENLADVKGVRSRPLGSSRTRGYTIDADGHHGDGRGHPIAENQAKRGADLPQATRPVWLDLPILNPPDPGNDLRKPFPL